MNRDRDSVAMRHFFGIHVRISKSTRTFEFRTIWVSPRKFLKRSRSSSFTIENGNNIMIFVKAQELCVPVEILGHFRHHMVNFVRVERSPHPPAPTPPSSPHPPPPPISWCVVSVPVCGARSVLPGPKKISGQYI